MKITTKQADNINEFLCFGIKCGNCPFAKRRNGNGLFDCTLTEYFSRKDLRTVEVDESLFNVVFNNKEYYNKCRELNPEVYRDVAKFFYGAKLK